MGLYFPVPRQFVAQRDCSKASSLDPVRDVAVRARGQCGSLFGHERVGFTIENQVRQCGRSASVPSAVCLKGVHGECT